ncbi:hypothetical protein PQX77_016333 [Marasmius sp. AFHP31]|nr:hypothetical protein PQX77_016333 [Marasmius sp. AFHP31]
MDVGATVPNCALLRLPKPQRQITCGTLVLHILLNDERTTFLRYLSPATTHELSRCCVKTFREIYHYNRHVYNIDRFLSPRIGLNDVERFRAIQIRTNALIGGTSALQFLEGSQYLDGDLMLYVNHASWGQFMPFLANVGYEFFAKGPQPTTLSALLQWIRQRARETAPLLDIVEGSKNVVTVLHFVRERGENHQRILILVTRDHPMATILSMKSSTLYPRLRLSQANTIKACNMAVIAGTHAISVYPFSTHHRREGVINCKARPITPQVQNAVDMLRNFGYDQRPSASHQAVLKQNSEFNRHRMLGDDATWILPLYGAGIPIRNTNDAASLPMLKGVSWTSSLAVRGVFAIEFETRGNCNWSTAYPLATPCRGLANHPGPNMTSCSRCIASTCTEIALPSTVLEIINRHNLKNDGLDDNLRSFVKTAFGKIRPVDGKHRDWYPEGNTAYNLLTRLKVPFHILRYKPRATLQFSYNPRVSWMRAHLNIQIPNCYPSPGNMILAFGQFDHYPAPSGIKMAIGFGSDSLPNLDEDFSALTSAEGFIPPHDLQLSKQNEAADEIRTLVRSAMDKMNAMYADGSVVERPSMVSEERLRSVLVALYWTLDTSPNITFEIEKTQKRLRLRATVNLPDDWPKIHYSPIQLTYNHGLAMELEFLNVSVNVLKDGYPFVSSIVH